MITNTGRNILAKYLIGQAPAYASHIAIGCGAKPIASNGSLGVYSDYQTLDFEMFRVPIISRGYVNEDGISKIVFTAELPTTERYEISEIGVFSSGSNPSAGAADSKTLFTFSDSENWMYHNSSGSVQIPTVTASLGTVDHPSIITQDSPVFSTNADNRTMQVDSRIARYEQSRFFNKSIFMAGNDASLVKLVNISAATKDGTNVTYTTTVPHTLKAGDVVTVAGVTPSGYNKTNATVLSVGTDTNTFVLANNTSATYTSGGTVTTNHLIVAPGSHHIHLTGARVDLSKNLPKDKIKIAFSVINKNGEVTNIHPSKVRILVEFASTDDGTGSWARFEAEAVHGAGPDLHGNNYDLVNNRYVVIEKELQSLYTSTGFTWNNVSVVKMYATVLDDTDTPSSDYYVAIDAMRIDNLTSPNPLYGMTGYSVIKNTNAATIVKLANTTNLVEFRFAIDVSV
jgi:hypothetical protein